MNKPLTSADLTPIALEWRDGTVRFATCPPGAVLLRDMLDMGSTMHRHRIARAVEARQGFGFDEWGFRFPGDELDPGEDPLPGVEIYGPFGEVLFVEEDAFVSFVVRWLAAWRSEPGPATRTDQ